MLSAVSFLLDPGHGTGIANVPSVAAGRAHTGLVVDGKRLLAGERFLGSCVSYLCGSSHGWSPLATVETEPTAEKEDENNDDDEEFHGVNLLSVSACSPSAEAARMETLSPVPDDDPHLLTAV
jgi:hypothetical protein